MKAKELKGNYFYINKVKVSPVTTERLQGSELCRLLERIKSDSIDARYMGTDESKNFILVPGDEIGGDSNLFIPEQDDRFFYGLFAKLSDADQHFQASEPEKNRITINKVDIDLSKQEMAWTFFLVEKQLGIILLIENQSVGLMGTFCRYLRTYLTKPQMLSDDFAGTKISMSDGTAADNLELIPIADDDSASHLYDLSSIKEVSISVPKDKIRSSGYFSNDLVSYTESGLVSVEFKIKAERNGSLVPSSVINLFSLMGPNSAKFQVKGKNMEMLEDTIDFLAPKLSVSIKVKVTGKTPDPYDAFEKLKASFIANRKRLAKEF